MLLCGLLAGGCAPKMLRVDDAAWKRVKQVDAAKLGEREAKELAQAREQLRHADEERTVASFALLGEPTDRKAAEDAERKAREALAAARLAGDQKAIDQGDLDVVVAEEGAKVEAAKRALLGDARVARGAVAGGGAPRRGRRGEAGAGARRAGVEGGAARRSARRRALPWAAGAAAPRLVGVAGAGAAGARRDGADLRRAERREAALRDRAPGGAAAADHLRRRQEAGRARSARRCRARRARRRTGAARREVARGYAFTL
jgi:hypothetical protein